MERDIHGLWGRHANKGNDVAPAWVRTILSTLEANKDISLYDAGVHAQWAKNGTDSEYEIANGTLDAQRSESLISNSLMHVMVILRQGRLAQCVRRAADDTEDDWKVS